MWCRISTLMVYSLNMNHSVQLNLSIRLSFLATIGSLLAGTFVASGLDFSRPALPPFGTGKIMFTHSASIVNGLTRPRNP